MTVGKDVSALFPDVANCMQVRILELPLDMLKNHENSH